MENQELELVDLQKLNSKTVLTNCSQQLYNNQFFDLRMLPYVPIVNCFDLNEQLTLPYTLLIAYKKQDIPLNLTQIVCEPIATYYPEFNKSNNTMEKEEQQKKLIYIENYKESIVRKIELLEKQLNKFEQEWKSEEKKLLDEESLLKQQRNQLISEYKKDEKTVKKQINEGEYSFSTASALCSASVYALNIEMDHFNEAVKDTPSIYSAEKQSNFFVTYGKYIKKVKSFDFAIKKFLMDKLTEDANEIKEWRDDYSETIISKLKDYYLEKSDKIKLRRKEIDEQRKLLELNFNKKREEIEQKINQLTEEYESLFEN